MIKRMTKNELIERLKGYEWNDLEFKRARRGVPEDAYSTVSAFANTSGGWLIFGVKETSGRLEVSGVEATAFDKVQNDFLSCLRTGDKINRPIDVKPEVHNIDGRTLLAFFIPESKRNEKPVCIKGDLSNAYIRRGGGDERCTQREIERFIRDAAARPFDSDPIEELKAESFYDERTLAWYRRRFNEREPGRHETLSDLDFLIESGFLIEAPQGLRPTRASLLLFGAAKYIKRFFATPMIDFQIIYERFENWSSEHRWADRIVVEENIIQAWLAIVERYMKYADRPFEIDGTTLRRHDEPPDYISFREAAINLLIHQDYGDNYRHALIQIFRDRTCFWNPGDAFGTLDQLLEPGGMELRNPFIVAAFRRIGLSDQAGTGIRAIYRNWHQLGYVPPQIDNQRMEKAFRLSLLKELILSNNQKRFQKELGVQLKELEAEVFAYTCKKDTITITDVRAIGGLSAADARALLDRLTTQRLLESLDSKTIYALASHLRERYMASLSEKKGVPVKIDEQAEKDAAPSWHQVGTKSALSRDQVKILRNCSEDSSLLELMTVSGRSDRTKFRNQVLNPLIDAGLVEMTIPEKPRSSKQKYRLTGLGQNAAFNLENQEKL
jgi:ATP-dependent DNA helicase RecG